MIGRGAVLIGMSERYDAAGRGFLANSLFKHRQAERVIAVRAPKHRSCMHLDTVMTRPHRRGHLLRLPRRWCTGLPSAGRSPQTDAAACCASRRARHREALGIGAVRLITTGGDAEAEREQWNDANNVLTIRPGVVIGYGHRRLDQQADRRVITVLPHRATNSGRGHDGARMSALERQI